MILQNKSLLQKYEELHHWYAVYTMPRSEKKVEGRLQSKGFEVYLPLVESVRVWSDRNKKIKVPLIAGYVFVKCPQASLKEALCTQCALGVIRYLGKPAKLQEKEIEMMRLLQNQATDITLLEKIDLEKGEWMEVKHGPFMGLIGKYIRYQGKFRVVVEIETLGSFFEVNVPLSFLQRKQSKVA